MNQSSVARYSIYAQAIDYISCIKSETANQILSGEVKTSMEAVMSCYGKAKDEVMKLLIEPREGLCARKPDFVETKNIKATTIKDMPAFDPDAEINSLALTIPSWISSINRTCSTAKFSLLTLKARNQLEQELRRLQESVQMMLHALREVQ